MDEALRAACAKAMHVLAIDGARYRAARAVFFMMVAIGWWPRLARVMMWPPFVWFAEVGYTVVARNRRFFSRFLFRTPTAFRGDDV